MESGGRDPLQNLRGGFGKYITTTSDYLQASHSAAVKRDKNRKGKRRPVTDGTFNAVWVLKKASPQRD